MDLRLALWANRAGLLAFFLAFWCAVPEILGERRLGRLEELTTAWIGLVPRYVTVAMWAAMAIAVSYWAVVRGVRGGIPVLARHLEETGGNWPHALLAASAELGQSSSPFPEVSMSRTHSVLMSVALVLLAPVLLCLLGEGVVKMAVLPVIRVFAHDERTRRGFVAVGTALLASGLLFQLVATS